MASSNAEDDPDRQSFIVRIWREDATSDGGARWRGTVTHVLSRRQAPLTQLTDIVAFIAPYVRAMRVPVDRRPGLFGRLRERSRGRDIRSEDQQ